ncbi:MAG TPA: exonuclease SbcCD subunit D [Saprospiraceae bacterium]|nr:exonuclease SbcCD subunit D [Saprospiraceae bacterium]
MRILHFSDTHLGYNDLDKVTRQGVNLREQDFYDAFVQVIDRALEIKPDVIIHSGDFFHRPSPANRPMIFALEQLNRIAKAKIPIVIIAGNHSTPKTIYTSPILQAFKSISGVYPIFNQAYENIVLGGMAIHGLPHINDERLMQEQMDLIAPVTGKYNVIMLHTSIGKEYIMDEYGEQLFPKERIEMLDQFDYVALGHWHNQQRVKKLKSGWYCGSTERMSETEIGKEKGFYLIDFKKNKQVAPEFITIPTRPWLKIEIKKCKEKTTEEIETELTTALAKINVVDALLSVYFVDIEPLQSIALSNRKINDLAPDATHIQIKRQFISTDGTKQNNWNSSTETLDQLISDFIIESTSDKDRGKLLADKARYYYDLFQRGERKG